MRYLGGKTRLAPKFAPILKEALARKGGRYFEPFVGGFNVVPAIYQSISEAHCSDFHRGLITFYQALKDGWLPPEIITEADYDWLRLVDDLDDPLTAFAAFGCSFSGKEWGGYARDSKGDRDYRYEARARVIKDLMLIKACEFRHASVFDLEPVDAVVYCDPPYRDTTGYRTGWFDHERFYEWCEDRVIFGGCEVFVSEFTAPWWWEEAWAVTRKITVQLHASEYSTRRDVLYRVTPI